MLRPASAHRPKVQSPALLRVAAIPAPWQVQAALSRYRTARAAKASPGPCAPGRRRPPERHRAASLRRAGAALPSCVRRRGWPAMPAPDPAWRVAALPIAPRPRARWECALPRRATWAESAASKRRSRPCRVPAHRHRSPARRAPRRCARIPLRRAAHRRGGTRGCARRNRPAQLRPWARSGCETRR